MNFGETQTIGINDALANKSLGLAGALARPGRVEQSTSSREELTKLLPSACQSLSGIVLRNIEHCCQNSVARFEDLAQHERHAVVAVEAK